MAWLEAGFDSTACAGMDKTCDATTAWLDACIASVEFAAFDTAPTTCVDAIMSPDTDNVLDA
jgi:hypothetical protein